MKKKMLLFIVLSVCALFAPSVMAASIDGCTTILPKIQIEPKIVNVTSTIITVIQIAVPVLLVIFGMVDMLKSVMGQKDDEIQKGRQIFIKRLLTAVLVFFVIAVVKLLISFVADDKPGLWECVNCFLNGAEENGTCKKSSDNDTVTYFVAEN